MMSQPQAAKRLQGTVLRSTGSWYRVRTEQGEYNCRIRGKLRLDGLKSTNPLAAGDEVEVEVLPDETAQAMVVKRHPRRNYIIRRAVNLARQTQIIAANLDQAVLIVTLVDPPTYPRFIDRFAVTAEAYSVPLLLVFNKIDLYGTAEQEELAYHTAVYRDAGYPVLHTSVPHGIGTEALANSLRGKRSLLSGHSGVGKSSLINVLAPELQLRTGRISDSHRQGQHTTTFAEMFTLSGDAEIIDSPGIRGFGLVEMEPAEIGDYFPEIFRYKAQCRFHNCLHLQEPGCAVREAVEAGDLPISRFESYLSFVEGTDDDSMYRQDQHRK